MQPDLYDETKDKSDYALRYPTIRLWVGLIIMPAENTPIRASAAAVSITMRKLPMKD